MSRFTRKTIVKYRHNMKEEDLIKKLENVSLPEIEVPSRKERLKIALLSRYQREKKGWEIFGLFSKIIPIGAAAALVLILSFNFAIAPTYNLAEAREIALKDPQVDSLIGKGAVVKDVQIVDGKAYFLIQMPEKREVLETESRSSLMASPSQEEKSKKEVFAVLAEVDIKSKRVSRIDDVTPQVSPLTKEEENKIKEIGQKNLKNQNLIPERAEVQEIQKFLPQLKLRKTDGSVRVIQEPRKDAFIIYREDGNLWEGKVDLENESLEKVDVYNK